MPMNERASNNERLSLSEFATVNQKTARIKQWVKTRLQELEDQNERLRAQNLRCTAQLALLKSCSDRTRTSLFFAHSVTGVLPTIRDFMECNRTSEDSGLTSDDTSTDRRQYNNKLLMTQSTNSTIRTTTTTTTLHHSPKTVRRHTVRTRTRSTSRGDDSDRHSSTTESSPADESSKPVPTPRKSKIPTGMLLQNAMIDRDSLEPYDDGCADDGDDEIFDEIDDNDLVDQIDDRSILELTDSMCDLESQGLHSRSDYVNLAELCLLRHGNNVNCQDYSKIFKPPKPPLPPKHRSLEPWEKRLHQLAEKCLTHHSDGGDSSNGCDSALFPPSTSSGRSSPARSTASERSSAANSISVRKYVDDLKSRTNALPMDSLRRNGTIKTTMRSPVPIASRDTTSAYATSALFVGDDMQDNEYSMPADFEHATMPPDDGISTIVVAAAPVIEKAGYLTAITDNRFKSLKRRFVKLKNGHLHFYKTHKEEGRKEEPLVKIPVTEIRSVSRVSDKNATNGLQICTTTATYQYTAESVSVTDEWARILTLACKQGTLHEFDDVSSSQSADCTVHGYLHKVKCGHAKHYYAALIPPKLMFYKSATVKIPSAQLFVKGAHIAAVARSSDESSGSSDDLHVDEIRNGDGNRRRRPVQIMASEQNYSLSMQLANTDTIYLTFDGREERDKWLYFLRLASRDGELYGTPFEVLVHRLMSVEGRADSALWRDVLLTICEQSPTQNLTTIVDDCIKKEALNLAKAAYLFTSVLMRSTGVQYHIDLAQNTLRTTMQNADLRNEFMAQLIRLTNGSMPYGLQAWKLLALAVSLFLPNQYAILWLLKKHLERWSCLGGDEANLAAYCQRALQRCLQNKERSEAPSKLEVTSMLTRDPCITQMPHSISVQLPTGDYQVVEFDGSSSVAECLSILCAKLGIRDIPWCGYALYSDDPAASTNDENAVIVMNNKHKLCDCLSRWERILKDSRCGRVPDERAIRLQLRLRHYWSHLGAAETETERLFLVYRMAEKLRMGHLPVSSELAEELCALLAQLHLGDCANELGNERFEQIVAVFYPARMLAVTCKRSLRANLQTRWITMRGLQSADCVRIILSVLRRWRFFGAHIYEAGMKLKHDQKIIIAVNDVGVHLLTVGQLDQYKSFTYQQLVSFGGYREDFMLTVRRDPLLLLSPEEPTKERLTFTMDRHSIAQVTSHIADYIKCRKLIWHASKQRLSKTIDFVPAPPQHVVLPRQTPRSSS